MNGYSVGDILVGDDKPLFADIMGDRREGMLMYTLDKGGMPGRVLAGNDRGSLEVLEVVEGSPGLFSAPNAWQRLSSDQHIRDKYGYFNREPMDVKGSDYSWGSRIRLPIPEHRTLFDCALSFAWSRLTPAANAKDFGLWVAMYSAEFDLLASAINMEDWSWIDMDDNAWWQHINISDIYSVNELARCAMHWHACFPDSPAVRGARECMF